jgi:hypothetical protein
MTPFVPASLPKETFSYQYWMTAMGITKAEAKKHVEWWKSQKVFINDVYQVNIRECTSEEQWGFPPMVWLSIKRIDKSPMHDWRELWLIKNELVGEENEAIELYPAKSRLVDSANQYHLWALKDPKIKFPFGFKASIVTDKDLMGATQRPFDESYNVDKNEELLQGVIKNNE